VADTALLFTYGTLRLPDVQRALYGHVVEGRPDTLPGHVRETITLTDHAATGFTGATDYPILRRTGDPADKIDGIVYALTPDELRAADAYETNAYARVEVTLASGSRAFVYVRPEPPR